MQKQIGLRRLLIILFFISNYCYAQDFTEQISKLNNIGKVIISNVSDEKKLEANSQFKTELKSVINESASYEYNFDSLKTISILKAGNLKIYNWAIPLSEGTFKYCAFVQLKKDKDHCQLIELEDKSDEITKPENKVLTPKNWYGALYYKIIVDKKLGQNTYTLLGWDGNNLLTNKKIIDVITIDNRGILKLGAPIFKMKKSTQRRIIFEYSENAVMSLKYHNNSEQIIFDYLVPTSSKLKGIYEYYGPALNRFDALKLDKSKWIYQEDINIELDKSIKDFMWNDPKKK